MAHALQQAAGILGLYASLLQPHLPQASSSLVLGAGNTNTAAGVGQPAISACSPSRGCSCTRSSRLSKWRLAMPAARTRTHWPPPRLACSLDSGVQRGMPHLAPVGGVYAHCLAQEWAFVPQLACGALASGERHSLHYICWPARVITLCCFSYRHASGHRPAQSRRASASHSKPSSSPSATPRAGPNSRPPRQLKLRVPVSSIRQISSACVGICTLAYDSAAWQPAWRESSPLVSMV